MDYEATSQKSFTLLKANAKTTSANACSASNCTVLDAASTVASGALAAGTCTASVYGTMMTAGAGSSPLATLCFLSLIVALDTIDDYITDCILCETYEEIDNLNDEILDGGQGSEGSTYNPADQTFGAGGYTIRCVQRVWSVTLLWTYCALWDTY